MELTLCDVTFQKTCTFSVHIFADIQARHLMNQGFLNRFLHCNNIYSPPYILCSRGSDYCPWSQIVILVNPLIIGLLASNAKLSVPSKQENQCLLKLFYSLSPCWDCAASQEPLYMCIVKRKKGEKNKKSYSASCHNPLLLPRGCQLSLVFLLQINR